MNVAANEIKEEKKRACEIFRDNALKCMSERVESIVKKPRTSGNHDGIIAELLKQTEADRALHESEIELQKDLKLRKENQELRRQEVEATTNLMKILGEHINNNSC